MRSLMKLSAILIVVLCLGSAPSAMADEFSWSYSGTGDSGSGMLTATPTGTAGQFLVTSISGTWDGSAISGLLAAGTCCLFPANDNILSFPASPSFLDLAGLGLGFNAGATDANIFFFFSSYEVFTAPANNVTQVIVTSFSGTFTASQVPEPATFGLLGSGLVGLFLGLKKRI